MKKITPLLAGLLALGAVGLASCGGDDADFAEVLDESLVYCGANFINPGIGGGEITDDNTPGKGNAVRVLKNFVTSSGKTAKIEWDYSESQDLVRNVSSWDENFDLIEINFSATETEYFTFRPKTIKIGSAKRKYSQLQSIYNTLYADEELVFNVTCKPAVYKYDYVPVSYFSKLNSQGNGYECIDYVNKTEYGFKVNYDQKKFDCMTSGKIVYIAADYDFFVLADGDYAVNVFMGSARTSAANDFPLLKVGNYVEVRGYLDNYNGAFQMTIINRIRALTADEKAKIAEPTGYRALGEAEINTWAISGSEKQDYVVGGLMGSMRSVTGTYVAGSLKNDTGSSVPSMSVNKRHTFQLQVGGAKLYVAYDYHVVNSTDEELFKNINKIFSSGAAVTIKGQVKYEGSSLLDQKGSGSGVWRITPLELA